MRLWVFIIHLWLFGTLGNVPKPFPGSLHSRHGFDAFTRYNMKRAVFVPIYGLPTANGNNQSFMPGMPDSYI